MRIGISHIDSDPINTRIFRVKTLIKIGPLKFYYYYYYYYFQKFSPFEILVKEKMVLTHIYWIIGLRGLDPQQLDREIPNPMVKRKRCYLTAEFGRENDEPHRTIEI